MAISNRPPDERGRANGVMTAGKYVGWLVGGPGLSGLGSLVGYFNHIDDVASFFLCDSISGLLS